jgi:uncharacterized integral membrane protein
MLLASLLKATMKHSEATAEVRAQRADYVKGRWEQLADLQKMWIERVIRYLFIINSGGAVAMLTFMSSHTAIAESPWALSMLLLFVIGVILVGVLQIFNMHFINRLYALWREEVEKFYGDDLNWEVLISADADRSGEPAIVYVLGYISFGCFITAAVIGGLIFNHTVR